MAVVLLMPTCLWALQSTQSLELFHNRSLVGWPRSGLFRRDPAGYFAQANGWLADRVYPVIAATYLKNRLLYATLGVSPAPNITVAAGGFVFLNGTAAETADDLLKIPCVDAAEPSSQARLAAALRRIAAFSREQGYPVDVVIAPTIPLVYGDRLPRSIPVALREACAAALSGAAPMGRIQAPEGMLFVYPLAQTVARREDPAMYPLGGYHARGLSVRLVTEAYLRALGAREPDGAMTLTSRPSEILESRGVPDPFPVYVPTRSRAEVDEDVLAAVRATARALQAAPAELIHVYRNPAAEDPATVLILSDSFGTNQGRDLAEAFRAVIQLPAPQNGVAALLEALRRVERFDRLVLVFNDTNLVRLSKLGEDLPPPADP